ncbi:MAG: transglycosylase SLT domain-containing protein [archaeon]
MTLKTLFNSTLASIVLAATAAPYTQAETIKDPKENAITTEFHPDLEVISKPIHHFDDTVVEPKMNIPELTKKYRGYWLSEEEYNQAVSHVKSGMLKRYEIDPYLGFVALMRHKPLIDFVAEHYGLDPMQLLEIINQETAFNISIRGESGERGIGQKMESTANVLVDNITNPEHELYYSHLDKHDYRFHKLSTDYRLNIILTAAMIKTAHSNLEDILEKRDMTREDLAQKVKTIGQKDTFWYLRKKKSKTFDYYNVTWKMRNKINKFWKENDVDLRDLDYLTYNGGNGCIANLLRKKVVSEVLQINFYHYSERKDDVENFLTLYDSFRE